MSVDVKGNALEFQTHFLPLLIFYTLFLLVASYWDFLAAGLFGLH